MIGELAILLFGGSSNPGWRLEVRVGHRAVCCVTCTLWLEASLTLLPPLLLQQIDDVYPDPEVDQRLFSLAPEHLKPAAVAVSTSLTLLSPLLLRQIEDVIPRSRG